MNSPVLKVISWPAAITPISHIVLSVVRNESLRLPYLLTYYRSLGFDRFLFVDNASTDGTTELLLRQPDCNVLHTQDRFGEGPGAGLLWKNAVLERFCVGHWVLVADADELLVWAGSESEPIQSVTRKLDGCGAEVMFTIMLDMYSERPFGKIGYTAGRPFVEACTWFDRGPYMLIPAGPFPYRQIKGGVRARLYSNCGIESSPPVMSKVPLVKWRAGQHFIVAQHALQEEMRLAPMMGALLHFKMLDDLPAKCEAEAQRGEYYAQGQEYRDLGTAIQRTPNGTFFDPAISIRYRNTAQLQSLGLVTPFGTPVPLPSQSTRPP